MTYTIESAVSRLLDSYKAYYDITTFEEDDNPLVAVCEYYESAHKYVLSHKAELWAANSEEFIFLFRMDHLTLPEYEKCRDYALEEGMKRAHIGPGHMYTYITPIFICEECDGNALKALRKTRIYKSFRFSFHGWMDFHTAVFETMHDRISSNTGGIPVKKGMKRVLFNPDKSSKKL